jgi:DNA-directed RNA polymerase specialized sigma24 family protein
MPRNHYVNNKKLLEYMTAFRASYLESQREGKIRPVIPDYIGECIMYIANRYSNKSNFRNYPFKEEMVSDGIETCIKYLHNFDPEKSSNPFAYFTQVIHFSFLSRIKKEKMQLYVKQKSLQNFYFEGLLADQELGPQHNVNVELDNPYMSELVETIDAKRESDKKIATQKKLDKVEKFYEE